MLGVWAVSQAFSSAVAPVFQYIDKASAMMEGGYLLIASFWLVLINAFRAVLLYNGWFLISEGAAGALKRPRIAVVLPVVVIPGSYLCMNLFHFPLISHFGMPALLTLASVLILQILCRDVSRYFYKLVIQSVMNLSTQWLDLIPLLTPYGFGWGELSLAVKQISLLIDDGSLLDAFSGLCFTFSFCTATLLAALFVSYEKQINQLNALQQRDKELEQLRHHQARARLYQEMQYLVHDLKRPLTVVMGLSDLLSISADPVTSSHGKAITTAAEKMDQMISEIRNPDAARSVEVEELMGYTLSQIRPLPWGKSVRLDCRDDARRVRLHINLIRVSRALVNLLDNAWHATDRSRQPEIFLKARRDSKEIILTVEDNGPGFLHPGGGMLSSWGSSGLGLSFVKDVAEASHGSFSMKNRPHRGLCCTLRLPEETLK